MGDDNPCYSGFRGLSRIDIDTHDQMFAINVILCAVIAVLIYNGRRQSYITLPLAFFLAVIQNSYAFAILILLIDRHGTQLGVVGYKPDDNIKYVLMPPEPMKGGFRYD